jgi:uncharacterized LabA/DUF88 family protein
VKTHVYVDGFNLYYGLLRATRLKWLNLEALFDQLLPKNEVARIYYFTALVHSRPDKLDQPVRQAAYLRALRTLPRVEIVHGTFQSKPVRKPLIEVDGAGKPISDAAGPRVERLPSGAARTAWVLKTEEKGSDVNLAAHLLRDAFGKACECAVIVSNDSDLLTPVKMARECGLTIGLAPPRARGSRELKSLADFTVHPRIHHLNGAQFPSELADEHGTVRIPPAWTEGGEA